MSAALLQAVPPSCSRDRFLAFAFAAADLLVEAGPDGVIGYAAGAFNAWFGCPPERFPGRALNELVSLADQPVLDLALQLLPRRGRLQPTVVRLSDQQATPMVLSGLIVPDSGGRTALTFGRLPGPPPEARGLSSPDSFARAAEARLRAREPAGLGLVELQGWREAKAALNAGARDALRTEIAGVLARHAGPGALAGELSDGRFGVLGAEAPDLGAVTAELGRLLRNAPGAERARVAGAGIALNADGLTDAQAARALRFALSRFAEGGTAGAERAGLGDGLAGLIALAESRARAVRAAIGERRFTLAYQPIVRLASRAVHHYEALLRPLPVPGSPAHTTQEFVTFAEAVGLSEELDAAVLDVALLALRAAPAASAAVNVSGLSMQSPAFGNAMLARLARAGNAAGRLLVELTETADISDVPAAARSVEGLRAAGVAVCLDDFGAGSAAFRYLRDLPVDFVKLDGAYVQAAPGSGRDSGFVVSMVELANWVGAKVIAEQIETEEQARLMLSMGVEYGQGWLFGRPGRLPGGL